MTDLILLVRREFSTSLASALNHEQRVITKTTTAARRIDDLAMPLRFADHRTRIIGAARQDDHAVVMRLAVGCGGEQLEQLAIELRACLLDDPQYAGNQGDAERRRQRRQRC